VEVSSADGFTFNAMKKFRFIIALVSTLCIMQGGWAISPGGTLGGGGKSAQRHPATEGKTVTDPATSVGPIVDPAMADITPESPIAVQPTTKKAAIGKTGSEGQSNQEVGDEAFAAAVFAHDSEKAQRTQFKEAIAAYRLAHQELAAELPVDASLLWLALLPMLLPPLAVYLKMGSITSEFWISVMLTPLLLIPGVIYAAYVVLAN
jgi:uncharacterized membrane protein YqaE (UPF0057 family)